MSTDTAPAATSSLAPPPPPPPHTPHAPRSAPWERPRDGRVLGGVCAGVADRFGWQRRTVRILAVASILLPGPQVVAYIIAWAVMPDAGDGKAIVDVGKVRYDLDTVIASRR